MLLHLLRVWLALLADSDLQDATRRAAAACVLLVAFLLLAAEQALHAARALRVIVHQTIYHHAYYRKLRRSHSKLRHLTELLAKCSCL